MFPSQTRFSSDTHKATERVTLFVLATCNNNAHEHVLVAPSHTLFIASPLFLPALTYPATSPRSSSSSVTTHHKSSTLLLPCCVLLLLSIYLSSSLASLLAVRRPRSTPSKNGLGDRDDHLRRHPVPGGDHRRRRRRQASLPPSQRYHGHRDPLPADKVQRDRGLPPHHRHHPPRPPRRLEGQDGGGAPRRRRLLGGPRLFPRREAAPRGGHQGDQGLAVRRAAGELRPRPPRGRRPLRGRGGGGAREGRRVLPVQVLQAGLRHHLPLPGHPGARGDHLRHGGQGRREDHGGERARRRHDPEVVPRRRERRVSHHRPQPRRSFRGPARRRRLI